MENLLVWVLLAPISKASIEKRIDELLGARNFDTRGLLAQWEILQCDGEHSAVLNRIPGSEQIHEVFLAEKLSVELGKPVHVLYMDPEYGSSEVIDVYEAGRMTGGVRGSPRRFASEMGCELPEE